MKNWTLHLNQKLQLVIFTKFFEQNLSINNTVYIKEYNIFRIFSHNTFGLFNKFRKLLK